MNGKVSLVERLAARAETDMKSLMAAWEGAKGQEFRDRIKSLPLYALDGKLGYTFKPAFIGAHDGQYFPPAVVVRIEKPRQKPVTVTEMTEAEFTSVNIAFQSFAREIENHYS